MQCAACDALHKTTCVPAAAQYVFDTSSGTLLAEIQHYSRAVSLRRAAVRPEPSQLTSAACPYGSRAMLRSWPVIVRPNPLKIITCCVQRVDLKADYQVQG